jgi:hypothetical protein
MNLTLSKVKIHPDISDETNCFSATINLDGKVVGTVQNDGHGGCHMYYWNDHNAGKQIEAWAEQQPMEFEFEKLDQIINKLLYRQENIRWLTRNTKSKTLFRLSGEPLGEWHTIKSPFNEKVKSHIISKYGQVECIANENLEEAEKFCLQV